MTSDPNTVAALANRMSAAGLIERQTDPKDRRALRLRLSPEGKRRFRQLQQLATVLQREVLEGVSKTERARFLDQLDRVAAACRMAAEQSPNRQAARPRRGAARE
jgi:DNA-binding MarR family transcriptional regulator